MNRRHSRRCQLHYMTLCIRDEGEALLSYDLPGSQPVSVATNYIHDHFESSENNTYTLYHSV